MTGTNSGASFKRKFPRRIFDGNIGVLHRGHYIVTKSISIGEGGISFLWPSKQAPQGVIVITFRLPGDAMLSLRAEIKNTAPMEDNQEGLSVGTQFLPLPIGEKRRIRAFVSSRAENEPVI